MSLTPGWLISCHIRRGSGYKIRIIQRGPSYPPGIALRVKSTFFQILLDLSSYCIALLLH